MLRYHPYFPVTHQIYHGSCHPTNCIILLPTDVTNQPLTKCNVQLATNSTLQSRINNWWLIEGYNWWLIEKVELFHSPTTHQIVLFDQSLRLPTPNSLFSVKLYLHYCPVKNPSSYKRHWFKVSLRQRLVPKISWFPNHLLLHSNQIYNPTQAP